MNDDRPSSRLIEDADIVFTATVRADRMRFAEVPETSVRFAGEPGEESGSGSRRDRLPERVREGEEYRNVRIEYVIASRIAFPGAEDGQEEPDRRT
ncbi:hypothetical protein AB0K05_05355 [Nonomuraea sp. NPDC049486]|uniref:hypothetical protein n=1 Tax=Nonomuraea sp. NPDC049486 TaxID=3155773 RepID=UPI00344335DA